jgi:hypothetical protein
VLSCLKENRKKQVKKRSQKKGRKNIKKKKSNKGKKVRMEIRYV